MCREISLKNFNDSIGAVRGGVLGISGCSEVIVATKHGKHG